MGVVRGQESPQSPGASDKGSMCKRKGESFEMHMYAYDSLAPLASV